ncbi:hypothetical protein D9758_001591 [Tetrapyrgos nigripes]|uniref:Uncharacterized protein n=1 Tax=Tetrapyrgos nigripes TaxID=182062 RepID=A0A8H5GXZ6_9AGAR|nr:hypothetical protein D9758_001591 [Tetrapyrgos nigripes]
MSRRLSGCCPVCQLVHYQQLNNSKKLQERSKQASENGWNNAFNSVLNFDDAGSLCTSTTPLMQSDDDLEVFIYTLNPENPFKEGDGKTDALPNASKWGSGAESIHAKALFRLAIFLHSAFLAVVNAKCPVNDRLHQLRIVMGKNKSEELGYIRDAYKGKQCLNNCKCFDKPKRFPKDMLPFLEKGFQMWKDRYRAYKKEQKKMEQPKLLKTKEKKEPAQASKSQAKVKVKEDESDEERSGTGNRNGKGKAKEKSSTKVNVLPSPPRTPHRSSTSRSKIIDALDLLDLVTDSETMTPSPTPSTEKRAPAPFPDFFGDLTTSKVQASSSKSPCTPKSLLSSSKSASTPKTFPSSSKLPYTPNSLLSSKMASALKPLPSSTRSASKSKSLSSSSQESIKISDTDSESAGDSYELSLKSVTYIDSDGDDHVEVVETSYKRKNTFDSPKNPKKRRNN